MRRTLPFNLTLIALLCIILLAVYVRFLVGFFTDVPSAAMSRGILVGETEPVEIGPNRVHHISIPSSDGKSVLILAIDGNRTRLITVDDLGRMMSENSLDLDLSQSEYLNGYQRSEDQVTVFLRRNIHEVPSLERIDINMENLNVLTTVIEQEVKSFKASGPIVIIEKAEGLYAYNADLSLKAGPVSFGPVLRYQIDYSVNEIVLIYTIEKPLGHFDIISARLNSDFSGMSRSTIMEDSSNDFYRRLQDIQVSDERVFFLSVLRDNKYGLNNLTIVRSDKESGKISGEFQTQVPLQNSPYYLVEDESGAAAFLLSRKTVHGYNLIKGTFSAPQEVEYADLTKTRPLSIPAGYFSMSGYSTLIFSDISDDGRLVYFASDNPILKDISTKMNSNDLRSVLGAFLTIFIVTLFLTAIYLLMISILPLGFVLVFLKRAAVHRHGNYILCAVGSLIYTGLKLAVVRHQINKTVNYKITAPLVGEEPWIYLVLLVMSFFSYTLIFRYLKPSERSRFSTGSLFFRFLLVDSVQFSLIFLIYIATNLMMGKF